MSETESQNSKRDIEYVKRKFSITAQVDSEIRELADDYYDGNRSRCVRQAIRDHKRTHEGENEFTIGKLENKIDQVIEDIQNLNKSIRDNIGDPQKSLSTPARNVEKDSSQASGGQNLNSEQVNKYARIVSKIFESVEKSSLTREEIVERSNLTEPQVMHAIALLMDKGLLTEDTEVSPSEYHQNTQNTGDSK